MVILLTLENIRAILIMNNKTDYHEIIGSTY